MTDQRPNLLALLEQLGTDEVPTMEAERQEAQRQRVSRAIEIRAAHVRRSAFPSVAPDAEPLNDNVSRAPARWRLSEQRHRWGWTLGLAASVALGAVGWRTLSVDTPVAPFVASTRHSGHVQVLQGEAQVLRPGAYETRVSGTFELDQGDLVHTASGSRAHVTLVADVHVELSADTSLRLGDTATLAQSDVWLQRGKARFDVAKRPPNGKFAVHSPDTDVTVHGTNFTVEVRQLPAGIQTSVAVNEGLVSVAGGGKTAWLSAGQSWVSRAEAPRASEPPQPPPPAVATKGAPRTPNQTPAEALPLSTLGAENLMFSAAMSAKRRGDDTDALRRLDEFLSRYPTSHLAQNARVERFRLLKHLGHKEQAAEAALEYVVENPDGFARDEARGLAVPTTTAAPASSRPK